MLKIVDKLQCDKLIVTEAFQKHLDDIDRLEKMKRYYEGKHKILDRFVKGKSTPNNKLVANHAKYITTILTGFSYGSPIKFSSTNDANKAAISILEEFYKLRHLADHDLKMGKNLSIFGKAYELQYIDPDSTEVKIKIKDLSPMQTFLIRDNDLEQTVLAAVYYYKKSKDLFDVYLYTNTEITVYETKKLISEDYTVINETLHSFGNVPIVEFLNNDECQGDYEQVISLIDAYNLLQSDRINDKEQLVDAILVITGGNLPEGALAQLKKEKLLNLPDESAKAEWLTKNLNEAEVEVLKKTIKDDIHEFSFVPCITDENFAGNASGVAMGYKLIGLNLMAKEKETHFEKGIRLRLKRLFHAWSLAGKGTMDYENITVEFTHSLPVNQAEIANMIAQLKGLVSDETLLGQVPFVENAQDELKKLTKQKEQAVKMQQAAFSMTAYSKTEDVTNNAGDQTIN